MNRVFFFATFLFYALTLVFLALFTYEGLTPEVNYMKGTIDYGPTFMLWPVLAIASIVLAAGSIIANMVLDYRQRRNT